MRIFFLKFSQNFLSKARLNKKNSHRQPLQNYFRISQNGVLFIHREQPIVRTSDSVLFRENILQHVVESVGEVLETFHGWIIAASCHIRYILDRIVHSKTRGKQECISLECQPPACRLYGLCNERVWTHVCEGTGWCKTKIFSRTLDRKFWHQALPVGWKTGCWHSTSVPICYSCFYERQTFKCEKITWHRWSPNWLKYEDIFKKHFVQFCPSCYTAPYRNINWFWQMRQYQKSLKLVF